MRGGPVTREDDQADGWYLVDDGTFEASIAGEVVKTCKGLDASASSRSWSTCRVPPW